ncbi:MAG: NifB/NifX family molybdenum-iron cluster-binding protein [Bacillota bacterium]
MKLAISTENNQVAGHFGRCAEYTIAEIEDNKIISKETIENPGHQPGFLPRFLADQGINCIISGGMGRKAANMFSERNIETVVGVQGDIDTVLNKFLNDDLEASNDLCDH